MQVLLRKKLDGHLGLPKRAPFFMGFLERLKPSAYPLLDTTIVSEEEWTLSCDLCLNSVMLIVKESF